MIGQLIKDQFILKNEQYYEWVIAYDSFQNKPRKSQVCQVCRKCIYICINIIL